MELVITSSLYYSIYSLPCRDHIHFFILLVIQKYCVSQNCLYWAIVKLTYKQGACTFWRYFAALQEGRPAHISPYRAEGLSFAERLRRREILYITREIRRTPETLHFERGFEEYFGFKEVD